MEVRKSALLPYSAEAMFDLIERAEEYPQFLPLCVDAQILHRDERVVVGRLTMGLAGLRIQWTTRNPKRRPEWMAIQLQEGPFRRFSGEWRITPLGGQGCKIEFCSRYDFQSSLLSALVQPVVERIGDKVVSAFVARADWVAKHAPARESRSKRR